MKCKFYRGPYHGKVRNISDQQLSSGYVLVSVINKPLGYTRFRSTGTFDTVPHENARYELKMYKLYINGKTYTGPCMHPDGSLFLEYIDPRGK